MYLVITVFEPNALRPRRSPQHCAHCEDLNADVCKAPNQHLLLGDFLQINRALAYLDYSDD